VILYADHHAMLLAVSDAFRNVLHYPPQHFIPIILLLRRLTGENTDHRSTEFRGDFYPCSDQLNICSSLLGIWICKVVPDPCTADIETQPEGLALYVIDVFVVRDVRVTRKIVTSEVYCIEAVFSAEVEHIIQSHRPVG